MWITTVDSDEKLIHDRHSEKPTISLGHMDESMGRTRAATNLLYETAYVKNGHVTL